MTEDRGQMAEVREQKTEDRRQRPEEMENAEQFKRTEQIASFKDLRVYQLAFQLQQELFEASKRFPPEERYALTDQLRRSSRSVGANLAEAWQKRRYIAHFMSKVTDADGEQAESQHWIDTAAACQYISEDQRKDWTKGLSRVGQMLGAMLAQPDKFCMQSQ